MSKRSVLFTITTILLLLSIFVLARTYLERVKEFQESFTESGIGHQLRYIEDDIISDSFTDLLQINLNSINRTNDEVRLYFSNAGKLSKNINHTKIISDYVSFVSGWYSTLSNINVTFTNMAPVMVVQPYNTTFTYNSTTFSLATPNHSVLKRINATIIVNNSINNIVSNSSPSNSSTLIEIIVNIRDSNNEGLLTNTSAWLDPVDPTPTPFQVRFPNGTFVNVLFGKIDGREGTFKVELNGSIEANITTLEIAYNITNETIFLRSGANVSIQAGAGEITKQEDILLAEDVGAVIPVSLNYSCNPWDPIIILTDKSVYSQYENVTINGTCFIVNGNATVWIRNATNQDVSGFPVNVTADTNGNISLQWNATVCGDNFTVSAEDLTTGRTDSTGINISCEPLANVTVWAEEEVYILHNNVTILGEHYSVSSNVTIWLMNSTENMSGFPVNVTADTNGNISLQWNASVCNQTIIIKSLDINTSRTANDTFNVSCGDTLAPTVNLIIPLNNNVSPYPEVLFIYNVSDSDSGIENCSLIINGSINVTNSTVLEDQNQSFTLNLADGTYTWQVNCTDNSTNHNVGASEQRNLTVNITQYSGVPASCWEEDSNPTWDVEVQFYNDGSYATGVDESHQMPDWIECNFPDLGIPEGREIDEVGVLFVHRDDFGEGDFPGDAPERHELRCYDGFAWQSISTYPTIESVWTNYTNNTLASCINSVALANDASIRITYDPASTPTGSIDLDYVKLTVNVIPGYYPELCERVEDAPQPVDFSSGLNTSGNTFGLGMGDDCWDWMEDYNYSGEAACEFNVDPDMDGDISDSTVAADNRIEIRVGGGAPGARKDPKDDDYDGPMSSCAYGIEFNITSDLYNRLSNGASALLSFNWVADRDAGWGDHLDKEDEAWVKARLTTPSQVVWLGSDLDSGDNDADPYNEIYFMNNPSDDSGYEVFNVTSYITQVGAYYLDFGAFIGDWDKREEGFGAYFDNIKLVIRS